MQVEKRREGRGVERKRVRKGGKGVSGRPVFGVGLCATGGSHKAE